MQRNATSTVDDGPAQRDGLFTATSGHSRHDPPDNRSDALRVHVGLFEAEAASPEDAATAAGSERPEASDRLLEVAAPEGSGGGLLESIMEVNWGSDAKPLPCNDLPEEKTPSCKSLEQVEKATRRKRCARPVIGQLLVEGEPDRAEKLDRCGSWVVYREWLHTGSVRLRSGNFCQQPRLCMACARAKAAKVGVAYTDKTLQLLRERDLIPHMITLTVPNSDDLLEAFTLLKRCLQQVRQKRRNQSKGLIGFTEWSRFVAAAWHIEIKRGKNRGLWHPHVHGIVLTPRGEVYDLGRLKEEWRSLTGGNAPIDVRLTNAGRQLLKFDWSDVMNSRGMAKYVREAIKRDLLEVFKYPLKFGDLSPADVVYAWRVTRRKRMLLAWEGYHGCKVDEDLNDLTDEQGEYLDHIYRWLQESGRYSHEWTQKGASEEG